MQRLQFLLQRCVGRGSANQKRLHFIEAWGVAGRQHGFQLQGYEGGEVKFCIRRHVGKRVGVGLHDGQVQVPFQAAHQHHHAPNVLAVEADQRPVAGAEVEKVGCAGRRGFELPPPQHDGRGRPRAARRGERELLRATQPLPHKIQHAGLVAVHKHL